MRIIKNATNSMRRRRRAHAVSNFSVQSDCTHGKCLTKYFGLEIHPNLDLTCHGTRETRDLRVPDENILPGHRRTSVLGNFILHDLIDTITTI
jgi:hypothetical protein